MFRPVKTKKVYEEIVEQIKKLIVDGRLQPGDKLLSERELSERFKVSRASVREAFSALEIMGIIAIRPGEGSFVRQVSYEGMLEPLSFYLQMDIGDIMHLIEVRRILEVEIAGLAAVRATPQDIEDIGKALNSMVVEVGQGELGDLADTNFHFAVTKAANNPLLIRVADCLSGLMTKTFHNFKQKLYLVEHMPEMIYESHCGIYEAIAAKDAKLARVRMQEHLSIVEEALLALKKGGVRSLRKYSKERTDQHKLGISS
jgi:GntR family transcriptional repressor for pyruvate dehydrogenase complex